MNARPSSLAQAIWSRHLTPKFVYFVVTAVVLQLKRRIIDGNMEFDDMLQASGASLQPAISAAQLTNEVSGHLVLEDCMAQGEAIALHLRDRYHTLNEPLKALVNDPDEIAEFRAPAADAVSQHEDESDDEILDVPHIEDDDDDDNIPEIA